MTIAPDGGVTQNAVAYGVIIDDFQPETDMSLDAATHQLIANLRQSNPGLRTIGNDESIRVNGVLGPLTGDDRDVANQASRSGYTGA